MKTIIFIAAFYCLSGFAGLSAQEFSISGKINYKDTLMLMFGTKDQADTLISPDGSFHFSRTLKHPELLSIIALDNKNKRINNTRTFFTSGGSAYLETDFGALGSSKIQMTEAKYFDIYEGFRERFNPLVDIARKLIDTSYSKDLSQEEKGLVSALYNYVCKVEDWVIERFIRNNNNNIVGAYIFHDRFNARVNFEKAEKLLTGFSSELLTTDYLKEVKLTIDAAKKIAVGLPAPVLSLTAMDGDRIEFGKKWDRYTVIDFWGTWCPPCLKGMGKMKESYNRYRNKIDFVGVAYRDDRDNVKRLVEAEKIGWPQIINNDQKTDLVRLFNIYAAPTKIVIDREGKILKVFVGEVEDFYTYIEGLK